MMKGMTSMRKTELPLARVVLVALVCAVSAGVPGKAAPASSLADAVEAARERGGLAIYLGGDPDRLAALPAPSGTLVHVLIADERDVQAARERLQSRGLYGTVSIERASRIGRGRYPTRTIQLFDSKYISSFNTHMECLAFVKGVEMVLNYILEAKDVKGLSSALNRMLDMKGYETPAPPPA